MVKWYPARLTLAMLGLSFAAPMAAIAQSADPDAAESAPQQDAPEQDDGATILVQGRSEAAIKDMLDAVLAKERAPVLRPQYGRFHSDICPRVLGVPDAFRKIVEDRIRHNARRVGLVPAEPGCDANVLAAALPDPRSLIETLNKQYRFETGPFSSLYRYDFKTLRESEGPSWAWQVVGSLKAAELRNMGIASPYLRSAPPKVFHSAFVLIDVDELNGVTWLQLADFITFRAFAKVHEEATHNANFRTVATLFTDRLNDDADPASELTPADVALLRALYAVRDNMPASRQKRHMARYLAAHSGAANADEEGAPATDAEMP